MKAPFLFCCRCAPFAPRPLVLCGRGSTQWQYFERQMAEQTKTPTHTRTCAHDTAQCSVFGELPLVRPNCSFLAFWAFAMHSLTATCLKRSGIANELQGSGVASCKSLERGGALLWSVAVTALRWHRMVLRRATERRRSGVHLIHLVLSDVDWFIDDVWCC